MGNYKHSALRLKSAIEPHYFGDRPCVLSPRACAQSPDLSSQILECLGESLPKDSESISESTFSESRSTSESTLPVIASEAKQSIKQDSEKVDCHEAIASRNDRKTESKPHASLESPVDSEVLAERHALSAIESHSGDKRSVSPTLEALSGWGIVKGEGATSQFKPLPLNKKEKREFKEVNQALEVKIADSKAKDLESKNQIESTKIGDSEKWDLDSDKLESATDSESKIRAEFAKALDSEK